MVHLRNLGHGQQKAGRLSGSQKKHLEEHLATIGLIVNRSVTWLGINRLSWRFGRSSPASEKLWLQVVRHLSNDVPQHKIMTIEPKDSDILKKNLCMEWRWKPRLNEYLMPILEQVWSWNENHCSPRRQVAVQVKAPSWKEGDAGAQLMICGCIRVRHQAAPKGKSVLKKTHTGFRAT